MSWRQDRLTVNLSLGGGPCNAILSVVTTKGLMDGIARFHAAYVF
jgi:hypothetical protein